MEAGAFVVVMKGEGRLRTIALVSIASLYSVESRQ